MFSNERRVYGNSAIHDLKGQMKLCDTGEFIVYVPSKSALTGLERSARLEQMTLPPDTTRGVQDEKHQDSLHVRDQEELEIVDRS